MEKLQELTKEFLVTFSMRLSRSAVVILFECLLSSSVVWFILATCIVTMTMMVKSYSVFCGRSECKHNVAPQLRANNFVSVERYLFESTASYGSSRYPIVTVYTRPRIELLCLRERWKPTQDSRCQRQAPASSQRRPLDAYYRSERAKANREVYITLSNTQHIKHG